MTKWMQIILGSLLILVGIAAPYTQHTLWAFFLSTSPTYSLIRELLGFTMICYAIIPELRTKVSSLILGVSSICLVLFAASGAMLNWLALLDAYLFSMAAIFCLLASLELSVQPSNNQRLIKFFKQIHLPKNVHVYHAH